MILDIIATVQQEPDEERNIEITKQNWAGTGKEQWEKIVDDVYNVVNYKFARKNLNFIDTLAITLGNDVAGEYQVWIVFINEIICKR